MKYGTYNTEDVVLLRLKAEEYLNIKEEPIPAEKLSEIDTLRLIHELEVHQIELEMQNDELVRINAEKDKLFSILAHDLRNPFSSFLGLTEILANDLYGMSRERIQEMANSLRNSAVNVYQLVEDLLQWSRMQRGLVEYKPETVALVDVLNKCIESLAETANKKNIEIQMHVANNLHVDVDLIMLESTIRNLLTNAIKFSFRGGKIEIDVKTLSNGTIEIDIVDFGIGISETAIDKLFQLNNTRNVGTEGEKGTGLGLLFCKEFVEKNGGQLQIKSKEGKGSTFSFSLPVSPLAFSNKHTEILHTIVL